MISSSAVISIGLRVNNIQGAGVDDLCTHIHTALEGQAVHSYLVAEGLSDIIDQAAMQVALDADLDAYAPYTRLSCGSDLRQHGGGSKR